MSSSNPPNPERKPQTTEDLRLVSPYDDFLALRKSAHTQENYHQDLKILKQFLDSLGIAGLQNVRPEHLIRFAGSLTKPGTTPSGKSRAAYSTRSMKRILAATRSFYRHLASIQYITNDPTAVFHNLNIRSPQRNPHPLAMKDRDRLVQGLQVRDLNELKVSLAVLLGFHCGLRVSEIAHLKSTDIHFDPGSVTVIGKGDKERTVPMTKMLQTILKRYQAEKTGSGLPPSAFLFSSPRSPAKPIHPDYIETWVKQAAAWAGLENPEQMTVHVLRHSFGSQLAESGASAYEIRDLMGHSSITVSENYVKLASNRGRQAHEKAFGGGFQAQALQLVPHSDVAFVLKQFRKNSNAGR
jgi:integrase/recombinase XerD